MIIISDTSPIANLILIDQLSLLKSVFQEVLIPPTVDQEIRKLKDFSIDLSYFESCDWITLKSPSNTNEVNLLKQVLDPGESEAIVLAKELNADYLLIDERIGTKKAREVGLQTIGLVGVIAKAKEDGVLDMVEPLLTKLKDEAGFWISEALIERVLKRVGEK